MARLREDRAISKHTLNLYSGDYQFLQNHYGTHVGAAKVIRDLVNMHVKKIRAKAEQALSPLVIETAAPELDRIMSGDHGLDLEETK